VFLRQFLISKRAPLSLSADTAAKQPFEVNSHSARLQKGIKSVISNIGQDVCVCAFTSQNLRAQQPEKKVVIKCVALPPSLPPPLRSERSLLQSRVLIKLKKGTNTTERERSSRKALAFNTDERANGRGRSSARALRN
jgi:hypothetical protein